MQATVTLKEGMSFTATAESGLKVNLGLSPTEGGADDGFRPMELMLIGLIGCTAMDVISILRKKRQEIDHLEVTAEAERAVDPPTVFTDILLTYVIYGRSVDETAVARSIELSVTKYCPAHAMLSRSVTIRHRYDIREQESLDRV